MRKNLAAAFALIALAIIVRVSVTEAGTIVAAPIPSFSYTDLSGSINTGGVTQTIAAGSSVRANFYILNEDLTNSIRVSLDPNKPASSTVGFLLVPGYYWEPNVVPSGPITVFSAQTGVKYSAGIAYN